MRIEKGSTGGDESYGGKEILTGHLLEDITRSAGHDRRKECLVVIEGRQDDRPDRRIDRTDVAADLDAISVGESRVQDGDVRSQRRNARRGGGSGAGFAHDFDVSFAFKELAQSAADYFVVIQQEDPDLLIHMNPNTCINHYPRAARDCRVTKVPKTFGFVPILTGAMALEWARHAGNAETTVVYSKESIMTRPLFVVGIDGSPASRSALRFAFNEVTAHGGSIHAVACWSGNAKEHSGSSLPPCDSYENASRILRTIIFEESADAKALSRVVREITEGDAGPALVAAARKATGLVIGATNEGPIARLTGHTVGDYCIRHSAVPVITVPWMDPAMEPLDLHGELHLG